MSAAAIPSRDPQFVEQSGLLVLDVLNNTNSGQRGAWELTRGSRQVVVAVLDSGVNINHADLRDNIYVN